MPSNIALFAGLAALVLVAVFIFAIWVILKDKLK
jgi:hypothetical protein